ncbi:MAG: hypothetical protein Q9201_003701 [Fulgogasparrea decipioides]
MIIRPLSFVCGALTSFFLFYLCALNYEIAQQYVAYSKSIRNTKCNATGPAPAGIYNGTTATGVIQETEALALESPIANATLGFEKILVINLPERTDRRDSITLTAAVSNIHLDFIQAVHGESIAPKARPNRWDSGRQNLTYAELGNWRSHVTALRTIIENNYTTALILEDDADWDIALRSQLRSYASITRHVTTLAGSSPPLTSSPYGHTWDILWLGTCATPPAPVGTPQFPNPHYDELLAAERDLYETQYPIDGRQTASKRRKSYNRLRRLSSPNHYVFPAHRDVACLTAYAVTQRSARELMGYLLDADEPTDLAVSRYCGRSDLATSAPDPNPKNVAEPREDAEISRKNALSPNRKYIRSRKTSSSPSPLLRPHPRAFSPATEPSNETSVWRGSLPAVEDEYSAGGKDIRLPEYFHNTPLPPPDPSDTGKNCIVVWPELIGQHRAAGAYSKDSDTGNAGKEQGERREGMTGKIVESARLDWHTRFGKQIEEVQTDDVETNLREKAALEWWETSSTGRRVEAEW